MIEVIAGAVGQAWANFIGGIAAYLPRALATLAIVLVGWLIALILRWVVRAALEWARFDALADRAGVSPVLRTADLPRASGLVASILFWIVWIGFLLSGVDALGFAALDGIVEGFVQFVPRLLLALSIVLGGFAFANFAWRATLLAAVNARLASARVLAGGVRYLILILAVAMALEHVAVARQVVVIAFTIAFGAVMLGLAIAFGVGGGPLAKRLLERQFVERSERPAAGETDDISHI
jgi:hypothetical protein